MIEAQQKRVERAVTDMINDMYKTHLKKMQFDMHLCAAKCCDDKRGTIDIVQNCIEGCAKPLVRAQEYLQHELGQFQGRLQNCVMQCSDDVRGKIPPTLTASELAKFQYQFEQCAIGCVDHHIGLIPNLMKTIKSVLDQGPEGIRRA